MAAAGWDASLPTSRLCLPAAYLCGSIVLTQAPCLPALQGLKNAVPKSILALMNVEGMTRENVASHLQARQGLNAPAAWVSRVSV
jgi:hypothetical protein